MVVEFEAKTKLGGRINKGKIERQRELTVEKMGGEQRKSGHLPATTHGCDGET